MKICGYTCVTEGVPNPVLDYDGSALLRCSRCQLQHYKDRAAQQAHWSLHQLFCKPAAQRQSSDQILQALPSSLPELHRLLQHQVQTGGSIELPYLLRKIRIVMDSKPADRYDVALEMHTFARGIVCHPMNVMSRAISAPGMIQFLLGRAEDVDELDESFLFHEDLLSDQARILKKLEAFGVKGRPTDLYIKYSIPDGTDKERILALCEEYDNCSSRWQEPTSMSYCYLYFNLIVACAVKAQATMSSIHDGKGDIRGGKLLHLEDKKNPEFMLALGALRRAMELWSDPLVLASCGDAMAPAASLAVTAMGHFMIDRDSLGEEHCRPHELVPGLTWDGAVKTCLNELIQHAGSAQWSERLLNHIRVAAESAHDTDYDIWKDLPIERRASVAMALVQFMTDYRDQETYGLGGIRGPPPFEDCGILFKTVCGMKLTNRSRFTGIFRTVWEKAAEDGERFGPEKSGGNNETRAFFYWLLRYEKLDQVSDLIEDKVKKFGIIASIYNARPTDNAAQQYNECMKLARGEQAHAETTETMQRMLNYLRDNINNDD